MNPSSSDSSLATTKDKADLKIKNQVGFFRTDTALPAVAERAYELSYLQLKLVSPDFGDNGVCIPVDNYICVILNDG